MSNRHAWFRARVALHLLSVLPEADAATFLEHASECADCGALLTRLEREDGDWWNGTEHISVPMLGAFIRKPSLLVERDRELVGTHLAACEACRADLAELTGMLTGSRTSVASPAPATTVHRRAGGPAWFMGAMVGSLATAAAFLLIFPRGTMPPSGVPIPPQGAIVDSSAALSMRSGGLNPMPSAGTVRMRQHTLMPRIAAPVDLVGVDRASVIETTRVVVAPGVLTPLRSPMMVSPAPNLWVAILDAEGKVLVRRRMSGEQFLSNGVLIDATLFAEGVFRLRVEWTDANGRPDSRECPFRVIQERGTAR